MGLRRGSVRSGDGMVWPGFVDAVTTLLMVLMFVLTIFTVMQSVLQQTISTQDTELNSLSAQVAQLADALGLEKNRAAALETEVGSLTASLAAARAQGEAQAGEIARLTTDLGSARGALAQSQAQVADLTQLLASTRSEVDAQTEAARLAAAQAEAAAQLAAQLKAQNEAQAVELTEAEATQLADAAALQALRDKLAGADTELTAMTLALEEQRKRAEETLTLLAAAQGAEAPEADLLGTAKAILAEREAQSAEAERRVALLNEQIAALRGQLGALQALIDAAESRDAAAKVQLENLGGQLNSALAQVAAEQKRRAELEEAERKRLEAEKADLEKFRSEFFGQLRQVLAGREGVRIVGDRFVFSSEVLFTPGSADLAPEGRDQIAGVVETLQDIAAQIPPGIDWIIRVDGHTDNTPLSGSGAFADNWQLSQARALSVVRYMQDELGFPPNRLAATGFGEWQPVTEDNSAEARAQNRRIELKLTER